LPAVGGRADEGRLAGRSTRRRAVFTSGCWTVAPARPAAPSSTFATGEDLQRPERTEQRQNSQRSDETCGRSLEEDAPRPIHPDIAIALFHEKPPLPFAA
jgi:hypothetical protein